MRKDSIFLYQDFGSFLQNEVEKNSRSRRGEKKRISDYLNIHPTLLSQIFNGNRQISSEQLFLLCEYLGYSELETDYIFVLYQLSITVNNKYKELLKRSYRQ